MRNVSNLALAGIVDSVRGNRGVKETNTIFAGVREVRRTVQVGIQIGENRQILDAAGASGEVAQTNGRPDDDAAAIIQRN